MNAQQPAIDFGAVFSEIGRVLRRPGVRVALLIGAAVTVLGTALSLGLLAGPLMLGYTSLCRRALRGESVQWNEVWAGFDRFGASTVLLLWMGLGLMIGAVLLVFPALVLAVLFTFAFPVLNAQPAISPYDALKESARIVRKHWLDVGVLWIVCITISVILGCIPLIGHIIGFGVCSLFNLVLFERWSEMRAQNDVSSAASVF